MKVPRHVSIILDGNRRFAKREGKSGLLGHKTGAEKVEEFLKWCKEFGIKQATLYAFSTENFNRSTEEVGYIMNLFKGFIKRFMKSSRVQEEGIKVRFIGDLSLFDSDIKKGMEEIMKLSKDNNKFILNLALGYGSKAELVYAFNEIQKTNKGVSEIKEEMITNNLWLSDDVDLFIRPGGEKRMSNFLLWQSSYAELYFSDKLWPEFSREDFLDSLKEYDKRERRFGV